MVFLASLLRSIEFTLVDIYIQMHTFTTTNGPAPRRLDSLWTRFGLGSKLRLLEQLLHFWTRSPLFGLALDSLWTRVCLRLPQQLLRFGLAPRLAYILL